MVPSSQLYGIYLAGASSCEVKAIRLDQV